MKVQLTFRSGAQAVVDVEKLQVTHDGPTKAITVVQWNDAAAGNRLLGLVPTEVVAVVELDAQPPPAPSWWELPHRYNHSPRVGEREHAAHPDLTCEQYHQQTEAETG